MKTVFITGGTGYMGKRLIRQLAGRGYHVMALVRKGSATKVPEGATTLIGDPFNAGSFQHHIPPGCIFVQLLGVSHPSPKKAHFFKEIDLRSVENSVAAAVYAGVSHFVYVSVSMEPSSIMSAYQEIRKKGEACCIKSGINCTFIRPWYVLGPGHWWPVLLKPLFVVANIVPALKAKAKAFGLVTIRQMIRTLVNAVESNPLPLRIIEIPDIKQH